MKPRQLNFTGWFCTKTEVIYMTVWLQLQPFWHIAAQTRGNMHNQQLSKLQAKFEKNFAVSPKKHLPINACAPKMRGHE